MTLISEHCYEFWINLASEDPKFLIERVQSEIGSGNFRPFEEAFIIESLGYIRGEYLEKAMVLLEQYSKSDIRDHRYGTMYGLAAIISFDDLGDEIDKRTRKILLTIAENEIVGRLKNASLDIALN